MSRLKDPRVILAIVLTLALMIGSRMWMSVPLPHVQLPAEAIPGLPTIPIPLLGEFVVTNTVIAILTTDLMLLVLAVFAVRNLEMVPHGLQNLFEAIIEWWKDQSDQMIGEELTRRYLPLFLTLFLLVTLSNWSELIPGYDTIGVVFEPHHEVALDEEGHLPEDAPEAADLDAPETEAEHTLFEVTWLGEEGHSFAIATDRVEPATDGDEAHAEEEAHGYGFVPFLRVAASDLNFTLALAIVAFIAIEIVGLRTHGAGYLTKFFHLDFSQGVGQGLLNIFVGALELISEFARIISFSFRLFGNLFAGQILLFVFPFLIPFAAVLPIFGLELFVGMIQGFVFAILTLAFMAVALVPPHGDEHH